MCDKTLTEYCKCNNIVPKNLHCPFICHHASICKLKKLLEEPLSQKSYELHEFYLNEYVEASKFGIHLNDMPYLTKILEILIERISVTPIYKKYLKRILKISTLIPLIHNDNEIITGLTYFGEYLSILGLLAIWLPEKKCKLLVYEALFNMFKDTKPLYLNNVRLNFRLEAAENSHLPEIITQLIEIVSEDEYLNILNIVLTLSQISNIICRKMLVAGAMDFLLIRLLPDENKTCLRDSIKLLPSEQFLIIFNTTCQTLINLVSSLKKETDVKLLKNLAPKGNSLWAIRYIFRGLLYDKLNNLARNSLMEFITLCIDIYPYLEIMECNLATDLVQLSVASEISNEHTWIQELKFYDNEYDLNFKKMLLISLCFIEKYPALHMIYETHNVVKGLLTIISADYVTIWHSESLQIIKKYAFMALYFVTPYLIQNFIANDGPASLLIIVESYILWSKTCIRDDLQCSLKILVRLLKTNNEHLISYTRYHSGTSVITMLCNSILNNSVMTYFEQEILSYSFCTLTYLYNSASLQNDVSISLLIKYFHRIAKPNPDDTCLNPKTVIAAIDYLWDIITSENDKLTMFIKNEGVYLMLDIIDVAPFPVKVIGLGALVDICENTLSLPFLLTWRGGTNKKQIFFSLLARIFKHECKKIGARLDNNGIILDINTPLMGQLQYQGIHLKKQECISNVAVADMLGSTRPKIYALIQLLSIRYKENTELINEHYKISNLPLNRDDIIILHLAEHFFALKLSESWNELTHDLNICDIKPIDIDAQLILDLTDKMQKWNESVKTEQETILKTEIKKEINLERQLYDTLKQCRLQYAIDALRELKYFARTTDCMFREAHKKKQIKVFEKDTIEKDYKVIHKTYMNYLNVTAIYDMQYSLECNAKEKKNKKDRHRKS